MIKPPPLLLALSLLFWGLHVGFLAYAIPMAILMELPARARFRLAFSDKDFHRLTDLTTILFVITVAYFLLGQSMSGIFRILSLLPFLLFLLVLGQRFSAQGTIKSSALFMSLRNKSLQGHQQFNRELDLSYPYLIVCILATSTQGGEGFWFYGILCMITAMALWPARPRRYSLKLWIALLAVAGALGVAGYTGLYRLQTILEETFLALLVSDQWRSRDPNRQQTAIGSIGKLKMSDTIKIRVRATTPLSNSLVLREALYDTLKYGAWSNQNNPSTNLKLAADHQGWTLFPALTTPTAVDPQRLEISLRFSGDLDIVPLPDGAYWISSPQIASAQRRANGAISLEMAPGLRAFNVAYSSALNTISVPAEPDIVVPRIYRKTVSQIIESLQLEGRDPDAAVTAIEGFFADNFRYSLVQKKGIFGITPLSRFLLKTRHGHCEYFASATVMLLRQAGIPARYAVGYSVQEYSALEQRYIARARHAHAWAVAYIDGRWRNVDTTPGIWYEEESEAASPWQWAMDLWSYFSYLLSQIGDDEDDAPSLVYLLIPLTALLAWRVYTHQRVAIEKDATSAGSARFQQGRDSPFFTVLAWLQREKNLAPRSSETLKAFIARISASSTDGEFDTGLLQHLVALHYAQRFDPACFDATTLREHVTVFLQQHQGDHAPPTH